MPETDDRIAWTQRYIFLATSVLFFIYWGWFSVDLIGRWGSMAQSLHLDASGLVIFSLGLWALLWREKANGFVMAMACFTFIAASRLALHLF